MSEAAGIARLEPRIATRRAALERFAADHADAAARACLEMARRFARGGNLLPYGTGPAATDAAHATVEFMHPVIVGKRALPALAPSNDPARAGEPGRLAGPNDIALGLTHASADPEVERFLRGAGERGALTIAMRGAQPNPGQHPGGREVRRPDAEATGWSDAPPVLAPVDFGFEVASDDPDVVQEVQETAYHVLWELVHVFFEHPGLLDDACITCGDVAVEARVVAVRGSNAVIERGGLREEVAAELIDGVSIGDRLLCHAGVALERLPSTGPESAGGGGAGGGEHAEPESVEIAAPGADDPSGFLYPFLDAEERDAASVLAEVAASTRRKVDDVIALRERIEIAAVEACAAAVRERVESGGRLITFGNGGSSTDAQDLAADMLARGWPAAALPNDVATVTAVGNDVGFELAFARQLIALANARDVAFAITTSGNSANILAGLEEAARRGMLTCALAGYDGGRLAELAWLDHLLVVSSDYVPRIQEAQATIYHLIVDELGASR